MKKYCGGCHCGKVRYEVTTDMSRVIECNCSHCEKKGLILTFVNADQFKLLSHREDLSEYQFNRKAIHHLFCRHCGVESFGEGVNPHGEKKVAINVRCLDGIDLATLEVTPFDGRKL